MNRTLGNLIKSITILLSTALIGHVYAQDRCGTVEYEQQLRNNFKKPESKQQFENWLEKRLTDKSLNLITKQSSIEGVVQIPVVVHIIHHGESVGNGTNIPDGQILSQIEVLNEDFRRMNADTVNTPSDFLGVAADTEVEFVMAKRDPEGLATNGIVRAYSNQDSWSMADNTALKAISYWPAEDYLNIWVTQVQSPLIGYAQFPVSSLEGLEDSSENRLTDGVVIDYEVFGSVDKYHSAKLKSGLDKGRTTTHEVGHFLGLRHIWGDGDCSEDDFCNDTPTASTNHGGLSNCSYPGANTCTEPVGDLPDMFQNYMDYTDDQCMNLFTKDQKSRMVTVLENSPRRASLTTSLGGTPPTVFSNDLGVYEILAPGKFPCGEESIPEIVVKNYGSSTATEVTLASLLDNNEMEEASYILNLGYLESDTISMSSLSIDNSISHDFAVEIRGVNNTTDDNASNDLKSIALEQLPVGKLPLSEPLNTTSEEWSIENPDGSIAWQLRQLDYKSAGDSVLYLNYYEYDFEGEQDWFVSPLLDLTNSSVGTLTFEIAHGQYPDYDDRLKVIVSTDCGNTYLEENVIYNKVGADLATIGVSSSPFVPTSSSDWRLEQLDLSKFAGNMVRIAFVGINAYGNNIYLDNINITGQTSKVNTPYPVSGVATQPLNIDVFNANSDSLKNLTVSYTLNQEATIVKNSQNINIGPGQVATLDVGTLNSTLGLNTVHIELSSSDGPIDTGLEENEITYSYVIDNKTDIIPLKEDFSATSDWISINPVETEIAWKKISDNKDSILRVNSFDYSSLASHAWYVSPTLDLSDETLASMFFDVSYAASDKGYGEKLTVMVSTDDGLSYPHLLYAKSGEGLTTHELQNNWAPKDEEDWRTEFIDLTGFIRNDKVRVAFVLQNNFGNNIYLDNIEFYEANDSEPVILEGKEVYAYPNPVKSGQDDLQLVFDLNQRQPVDIAIYDRVGKPIFEGSLPNTLNQHYAFTIEDIPTGLFILSVRGTTFHHTQRLLVIR